MKTLTKTLKWLGIIIGALLIIAVVAFVIIYNETEERLNKTYEVSLRSIELPSDSATLALGKHLSVIKGCTECHGSKFEGGFVINDPAVGVVFAPNLTRGKGGKVVNYTDEDWIRSIKHGVNPSGKPLWIMPSYEFDLLSEEDLSALISYVKIQEPVDSEPIKNELGPVGRILLKFDKIDLLTAEKIYHGPKDIVKKVEVEETAEYGKYLITSCIGCHRENLKGGEPIAPGFPPVPDITPAGRLAKYSDTSFINVLRTGVTKEGRMLNPKDMPWTMTKEFSDLEIRAIYKYLKTLNENQSEAVKM